MYVNIDALRFINNLNTQFISLNRIATEIDKT